VLARGRPAVGLICQPGLEPAVTSGRRSLGFVEIEPQVSWVPRRGATSVLDSEPVAVARLTGLPVLIHSVGAPVAGSVPPPTSHMKLLATLVAELQCPWVSEHLSVLRVQCPDQLVTTGVLMAPPQTPAAVEVAASNIGRLRDAIDAPVAFETGVNYLRPRAGEMRDGEFFRAVAEAADCGILLDLHNLWCNEQNGRDRAIEVIHALPADRVWEMHVAAGYRRGKHYLDAHSGLVGPEVLDLLASALPSLPSVQAVVLEISPDRLGRDGLTHGAIAEHLRQLADSCAGETRASKELIRRPWHPSRRATPAALAELQQWELALGGLVLGRHPDSPLAAELASDDGHLVWRDIAAASRRGQFAGTLPLTCRLLLTAVGETGTLDMLAPFWATVPPAETSVEEAFRIAGHLRMTVGHVPRLIDVLDYELVALQRALSPINEKP
jgi:uncharacterized protein (UPF0276 family)